MKCYFLFTAVGPLVILTSYDSVTNPDLIERLRSKGINKFIACDVPLDLASIRYGNHYGIVCRDLCEANDIRVLDYSGHRAFHMFSFEELGEPIYFESKTPIIADMPS